MLRKAAIISVLFAMLVLLTGEQVKATSEVDETNERYAGMKAAGASMSVNSLGIASMIVTTAEESVPTTLVSPQYVMEGFGYVDLTTEGGRIDALLNDKSTVELKENTSVRIINGDSGAEIVFEKGKVDVTFGSDSTVLKTPDRKISGINSRALVTTTILNKVDDETATNVTVFAIENGVNVENKYGLTIKLQQGQKITSLFNEVTKKFEVAVSLFNENNVKCEINGEEFSFESGSKFNLSADGTIEREIATQNVRPKSSFVGEGLPFLTTDAITKYRVIDNLADFDTVKYISPK